MTNLLEPATRVAAPDAAVTPSEPAWTELWRGLRALLHGTDPADRVTGVQPLKAKVYRLHFDARAVELGGG